VSGFLALVLAVLSSALTAYGAHRTSLAHFHVLGAIPVGALLMGTGAALGVAMAIRLTAAYDTANFRIFAQMGGMAAYAGAVLLDYVQYQLHLGSRVATTPDVLHVINYAKLLIEDGGHAIAAQLPASVALPMPALLGGGVLRLFVEVLGVVVATGWAISFLVDVPFCWTHHRFYQLRHLVECADMAAVQEWETAIQQRRPHEARALLTRVRASPVAPSDRSWIRVAVHQCSVCHAARVRTERRRRISLGRTLTEPAQVMQFDAARGSALLAT
jgi:hypothetical protein